MKLKLKIIKENKILKEINQPGINDELGATASGFPSWWGNFDTYTGAFQGNPSYNQWLSSVDALEPGTKQELEREISELQQQISKKQPTDDIPALKRRVQETSREWKHRFGGYCYGVNRYYGREEAERLAEIKISDYVSNAPEAEVEFLFANLDGFFKVGDDSVVAHSQAPSGVAFYGKPTDWWMFGDGYGHTKQVLSDAKASFLSSKGPEYKLPEPYDPSSPEPPTPEESDAHQRGVDRAASMADFFSRFYGDK